MKMKRAFALIIALLMALSLVACGGEKSGGGTPDAAPSGSGEAPAKKAGIYGNSADKDALLYYGIYKVEASYFANEGNSAKKKLEELAAADGKTASFNYVTCGNEDVQLCINYVDTAIADGADGILMCIPDQQMSTAIVEKCEAAGIPIVAGDDPLIDLEGNQIAPACGIDAYNCGGETGKWLANWAQERNLVEDEKCGLMIMTMSMVSSCVPRSTGAYDRFYEITNFPKERTYEADSDGNYDTAYDAAAAMIAAHPEYDKWLVLTANEGGAGGAANALEAAGLDENSGVVSVGFSDTMDQWENGKWLSVRACGFFSEFEIGALTGEKIYAMSVKGEEVPNEYFGVGAVMMEPETWKDLYITG